MCGRYSLTRRQQEISERFGLDQLLAEFSPRFNISPTQKVPVVLKEEGEKKLEAVQWGLIPSWVKDLKTAKPIINARSETLLEKQTFKRSLMKRRCIIPADGFYEWKKEGKAKIPMWIHCTDNRLFGFAGIYDVWKNAEGEKLRTFSIITCAANDSVAPVHDRMPVILTPEAESLWLDESIENASELMSVLVPAPNELITMHQVSSEVNSSRRDLPTMNQPVDPDAEPQEEPATESRSRKKKSDDGHVQLGLDLFK